MGQDTGWVDIGYSKGVKAEQRSLLSGTCSAEGGQGVLGEPRWAGILLSMCALSPPGLIHITYPCTGQVGDVQWMQEVSSSLGVPPFIPQRDTHSFLTAPVQLSCEVMENAT